MVKKKSKESMRKTFVLDTNVLIHDADSIFQFSDNKVVIPLTVIEELDGLKKFQDDRARNARMVTRTLDSLRQKGKLSEGVPLKNGGLLKIEFDRHEELPFTFQENKADIKILQTTLALQKAGEKVILITKDINLRIKGEAIGLEVQDYEKEKVNFDELYQGWRELSVPSKDIDSFFSAKALKVDEKDFFANQFCILKSNDGQNKSALGKYVADRKEIVPLFHKDTLPWGLKPLNVEQKFAIELLMSNEIKLVTLVGGAGTGKTLLALACGLQKAADENYFRRIMVARPIIPMGKDIGYLPGSKDEKLSSWMGAIYDNLDFLMDKSKKTLEDDKAIENLFDSGKIVLEALTYIRGRSLPGQYMVIDEAQNLTPHEIKTIISRAGEGTKVVMTGDPQQIDNPYLDASSNGLTYCAERFKGQKLAGHVFFTKTERSELAALATDLL